MNRFFKSAAFPILIVVVLAFLAVKLVNPGLTTIVKETSDGFSVTIKAEKPALWAWLNLENADANYSDNFFHVMPEETRTILIRPKSSLTKDAFVKELQVRSLFNTYL